MVIFFNFCLSFKINSLLFQNKLTRLLAQYKIAQSVNEDVAIKVERAKMKVKKDTPVFPVIEPIMIPDQRTSPARTQIVIFLTLLGLFVGISYSLLKSPKKN